MTWRTHLVIGTNAVWISALNMDQKQIPILLPAAVFASLLPDIDAAGYGAKIHYIGGGVLGGFKGMFEHRGITHSLFVTFILFGLLFAVNSFALDNTYPLLPYVFALSYLSHLLIDGFNRGVGYLQPFIRKRYALLPQLLFTPINGYMDNFLFFLGALGIILFLLLYINLIRLGASI
jgi:membrane-bound metal-dependent hydrolase YbcI (DUF457 family)